MDNSDAHGHGGDHPHGNETVAHGAHEHAAHDHLATEALTGDHETSGSMAGLMSRDTMMTTAVTVGVVGVAAVIFEAALIPGIVLGVAAALAPSYVPRVGAALNPLFRSTIRGAYKLGQKTKEAASEVREQMNDIAAEVNAEGVAAEKKVAAL